METSQSATEGNHCCLLQAAAVRPEQTGNKANCLRSHELHPIDADLPRQLRGMATELQMYQQYNFKGLSTQRPEERYAWPHGQLNHHERLTHHGSLT
jgi:hypothetical protein